MTKKEIEKLLKAIKQLCKTGNCDDCIIRFICRDIPSCMTNSDIDGMANELEKEVNVKNAPTVEERATSRWLVLVDCSNEGVYCENCHRKVFKVDYAKPKRGYGDFCPYCGASMVKKEGDTE